MTTKEAIYCMESYLPEAEDHCLGCPYYGKHLTESGVFRCRSSDAHRMAIDALRRDQRELDRDSLGYLISTGLGVLTGGLIAYLLLMWIGVF